MRARIDYGAPVICYTDDEIKTLEKDQIRALKRLLKLNYRTQETTPLAVTIIPIMAHRLATVLD